MFVCVWICTLKAHSDLLDKCHSWRGLVRQLPERYLSSKETDVCHREMSVIERCLS